MDHRAFSISILDGERTALHVAVGAHDIDSHLGIAAASTGQVGTSGCTRMVEGGDEIALNSGHSLEKHCGDSLCGGGLINNQEFVWFLMTQAPERIFELKDSSSCHFERNADGATYQPALLGQAFIAQGSGENAAPLVAIRAHPVRTADNLGAKRERGY